MSERLNPIDHPLELPDAAELLQQLCERQRAALDQLRDENQQLRAANHELGTTLQQSGSDRLNALKMLQQEVNRLKARTMEAVDQRDACELGLRELVRAMGEPTSAALELFGGAHLAKMFASAVQLLAMIDTLKGGK